MSWKGPRGRGVNNASQAPLSTSTVFARCARKPLMSAVLPIPASPVMRTTPPRCCRVTDPSRSDSSASWLSRSSSSLPASSPRSSIRAPLTGDAVTVLHAVHAAKNVSRDLPPSYPRVRVRPAVPPPVYRYIATYHIGWGERIRTSDWLIPNYSLLGG